MTYAFTFDASACTGCKACQVACKDKNQLPAGVFWRRVYEVAGGSWRRQGEAWVTDVFAYNLTMACNHCAHPKCAGVCPTDAFVMRNDGIVYIDGSKCMGCGYCNWACPYDAPQFHPDLGVMTKCDFCFDEIDAGLPPACVAACPMRALNYIVLEHEGQSEAGGLPLWEVPGAQHPFPLPPYSRTQPHVLLTPHPAMNLPQAKEIANREETQAQRRRVVGESRYLPGWLDDFIASGLDEFPLLNFTLLAQMAAGIAVFSLFHPLNAFLALSVGLLLGLGGLSSVLHLGAARNAWRAILHQKKSWLSREVLMAGLFGASWLALAWLYFISGDSRSLIPLRWLTASLGFGLVVSMARVYRLRANPVWDTWRTEASFLLAAGALGALATALATGDARLAGWGGFFLLLEGVVIASAKDSLYGSVRKLRFGIVAVCAAGVWSIALEPGHFGVWSFTLLVFLVIIEEVIGRWMFYALRRR